MNQDQTSKYVLKFISGKYQGGEFPLTLGKQTFIGRGSEFDMVLVEDMVSRKHACISSHNDDIYIEDLGSTNGTFVNGEKVKKARLKEGDRILIGTNIIKLVNLESLAEESHSEQTINANQRPVAPAFGGEGLPRAQAASATMTGAISGRLEEVPLVDLLRLFATSKKTGVLVIQTADDLGQIYLRRGDIYYASINDNHDLAPQKALYRIIPWQSGTFSLDPPSDEDFAQTLSGETESLIEEAQRQQEAITQLGDDRPKLDSILLMNRPLISPLRKLTPNLCDTLQLAHNLGLVSEVLDNSAVSDLDTMQDLVYLLRNDYIKIHG